MTDDHKGLVHFTPESKQIEVEERVELFQTTINSALDTLRVEMTGYEAFLRSLLYGDDYRFNRRKF